VKRKWTPEPDLRVGQGGHRTVYSRQFTVDHHDDSASNLNRMLRWSRLDNLNVDKESEMGDKGGKKDKQKGQKQKDKKQQEENKKKQQKQQKTP